MMIGRTFVLGGGLFIAVGSGSGNISLVRNVLEGDAGAVVGVSLGCGKTL
jgi:hypothetical protein